MSDETRPLDSSIDRPPADVVAGLGVFATTDLVAALDLTAVVLDGIHALWSGAPTLAGPAFTVRTGHHDNLMLHAAIYLAEPGDVIVVEAGDDEMAVCGGNVCAIAQRRGIAGFVVAGAVRDVAETRERGFPVYARGTSPIPAKRVGEGRVNGPVHVGGVNVDPGDVVVADEEGIVVVPRARVAAVLAAAQERAAAEEALDLDAWERRHRAQVEAALAARGYRLR